MDFSPSKVAPDFFSLKHAASLRYHSGVSFVNDEFNGVWGMEESGLYFLIIYLHKKTNLHLLSWYDVIDIN